MRLKQNDLDAIIGSIDALLELREAKLYLFGSRTNDLLRGGDIDLLLVCREQDVATVADKKYLLLANIKECIGDQKIDLAICSPSKLASDPFFRSIIDEAVLLNAW
ncbi:MAG: nucleotidyltransferase domain-containing protein [Minisyncoccia bacterium]